MTGTGFLTWFLVLIVGNVLLLLLFGLRSTSARRGAMNLLINGVNGVRVVLSFVITYFYIPCHLMTFREQESYQDRVCIGFTVMSAAVIVCVHILSLLRLYDPISGWLTLIGICVACSRLTSRRTHDAASSDRENIREVALARLFDAIDHPEGIYTSLVYPFVRRVGVQILATFRRLARAAVSVDGLLLICSMAYPAYIRFHHAITKAYYGYGDPYVHLAWMKYMVQGQMYQDGIYPHGMHSLLSILDRVFFLDPYWIVRYAGPTIGMLLVLTVLHFVVRVTGEFPVAVAAAFAYGIESGLPVSGWRQAMTMPQELATLFLLPGTVFLWRYLSGDGRRYLYLYLASYFLTLTIHPFAAMYLLIVTGCVVASCALAGRLRLWQLAETLVLGVIVSVLGALPYIIGIALGKPLHSVEWALSTQILSPPPAGVSIMGLLSRESPAIVIGVAGGAIAAVLGFRASMKKGSQSQTWLLSGLGLSTVALYVAYQARSLGLPQMIDPQRTQMIFSILCVTVAGCLLSYVKLVVPRKARVGLAMSIIVILSWVFHPQPFAREVIEYSAAAETYLSIEREFEALSWTLIAPVEQRQQVIGRGWHHEIWRFAVDFAPADVANETFYFPFPTPHVFVMVEKVPLGADGPVDSAMAARDLPIVTEKETDFYYRDVQNRSIVEARAIEICEAYAAAHEGSAIYYEDEHIRVYHFRIPDDVVAGMASRP